MLRQLAAHDPSWDAGQLILLLHEWSWRVTFWCVASASSATVERLFSAVGIAFSHKGKNAKADTLADIIFAKTNVE